MDFEREFELHKNTILQYWTDVETVWIGKGRCKYCSVFLGALY